MFTTSGSPFPQVDNREASKQQTSDETEGTGKAQCAEPKGVHSNRKPECSRRGHVEHIERKHGDAVIHAQGSRSRWNGHSQVRGNKHKSCRIPTRIQMECTGSKVNLTDCKQPKDRTSKYLNPEQICRSETARRLQQPVRKSGWVRTPDDRYRVYSSLDPRYKPRSHRRRHNEPDSQYCKHCCDRYTGGSCPKRKRNNQRQHPEHDQQSCDIENLLDDDRSDRTTCRDTFGPTEHGRASEFPNPAGQHRDEKVADQRRLDCRPEP